LFELITFVANNKMKHLGLFEGIGGFSLAARWMGWETLAWCEWNEFGQKVLKHYFPEAEGFGDITKTDFTKYANRIDILTGGFPCQPYSAAGKRLGKEDERHLWPEMLRVIREVQPNWVVGENVLGLVNWSGGLVFHEVQVDLEAEGYEVFPFVLPACAVNAPHRRDRVWFVAHRKNIRCGDSKETGREREEHIAHNRQTVRSSFDKFSEGRTTANTNGNGFNQCNGQYEINTSKGGEYAFGNANKGNVDGDAADTDSFGQASGCEQHESDKQGHNIGSNFEGNVADTKSKGLQGSFNNTKSPKWVQSKLTECDNRDVANTNSARWGQSDEEMEGGSSEQSHSSRFQQDDANTSSQGLQGSKLNGSFGSQGKAKAYGGQFSGSICNQWEEFPTQPPICFGDDGLSARLDSITFPKWRNESIKAAGNAIVPQVAFQIFKSIAEYELLQPG
jgi:DNA (cytosine-5)-methyltransferase 1